MADIYLIIYFLLIISVPILGIWFLSVNYRKPKIPVDYSILLNYMNGWTDSGHFEGVIVKKVKRDFLRLKFPNKLYGMKNTKEKICLEVLCLLIEIML